MASDVLQSNPRVSSNNPSSSSSNPRQTVSDALYASFSSSSSFARLAHDIDIGYDEDDDQDEQYEQEEEEVSSSILVRAMFDFQPEEESSLAFRTGDVIEILNRLECEFDLVSFGFYGFS